MFPCQGHWQFQGRTWISSLLSGRKKPMTLLPVSFHYWMKNSPCQSKLLSVETDKYHSRRRQWEPWIRDASVLNLSHPFSCWSGLHLSASCKWDLVQIGPSWFQHALDGPSLLSEVPILTLALDSWKVVSLLFHSLLYFQLDTKFSPDDQTCMKSSITVEYAFSCMEIKVYL